MQSTLLYQKAKKVNLVRPLSSIVDQLKNSDKIAQRQFYYSEFDRLILIPLRYVESKTEAITIVNDSFLKIFDKILNLKYEIKLQEWTAAIVRNTTIDYVRKKVKYDQRHTEFNDNINMSIAVNEALDTLATKEILSHIQSLSDRERVIFSMYAIDGYKHAEIANELNITEGTSKWYLHKARTSLQTVLKQYIS